MDNQTQKNYDAALLKAGKFLGLRQYEQAILNLEKAVNLNPDSPDAHEQLANCYQITNQLAKTIPHFQEAIRLGRNSLSNYEYLSSNLLLLDRNTEARTELERALEVFPEEYDLRVNLGAVLSSLGEWPLAIEHLEKAARQHPMDVGARAGLAISYCHVDQKDKGLAIAQQVMDDFPDELPAYVSLGTVHYLRDEWAEAIELLGQVVLAMPNHPSAAPMLASALEQVVKTR